MIFNKISVFKKYWYILEIFTHTPIKLVIGNFQIDLAQQTLKYVMIINLIILLEAIVFFKGKYLAFYFTYK